MYYCDVFVSSWFLILLPNLQNYASARSFKEEGPTTVAIHHRFNSFLRSLWIIFVEDVLQDLADRNEIIISADTFFIIFPVKAFFMDRFMEIACFWEKNLVVIFSVLIHFYCRVEVYLWFFVHPWLYNYIAHPAYFVPGHVQILARTTKSFMKCGEELFMKSMMKFCLL